MLQNYRMNLLVHTAHDVYCHNDGCSDYQCISFISKFYEVLVDSVKVSSSDFLRSKIKKDKFKIVPGWNRNVRDKYNLFRDKFFIWLQQGKPRDNIVFDDMKIARSDFKRALDYTLSNRNNEVLLSIQEKFKEGDMNQFWSEVRKKKGEIIGLI